MGDKFFVRSSEDGAVKGPYELDALHKSFDRGLLKADAQARLDGGEKWIPLKELLAPELVKAARKRTKEDEADFERARDRDREIENQRSGGSANVAIGAVMLIAGLGLTAVSLSAGQGGGVIFVGLILFGIIRIIRGAAAG